MLQTILPLSVLPGYRGRNRGFMEPGMAWDIESPSLVPMAKTIISAYPTNVPRNPKK